MRDKLLLALQTDYNSVRRGTCYKVILPLVSAHKFHGPDPKAYWEALLKQKINKRAESLMKQGLCQRHVLTDMLVAFVENELMVEHRPDLPPDFDVNVIYPTKHFLCSLIHRFHVKNPQPDPHDLEVIRRVKVAYIEKVQ